MTDPLRGYRGRQRQSCMTAQVGTLERKRPQLSLVEFFKQPETGSKVTVGKGQKDQTLSQQTDLTGDMGPASSLQSRCALPKAT